MSIARARVTVGLVVHDEVTGLVRSVASILNQSCRDETALIIVDDGSTDDTALVTSRLQREHARIEVLRNEQPRGMAVCRNQIISTAKSNHLAWADAGDLWHRQKLEIQLQTLLESDVDPGSTVCLCPAASVHSGRYEPNAANPDGNDHTIRELFHLMGAGFRSMLAHIDVYQRMGGFDERLLGQLADEDYCIRLKLADAGVIHPRVHRPVLFLPEGVGSATYQPRYALDANLVWQNHKAALQRRYGWRSAAEYRRRQLLAVAGHMREGGERWQTLGPRLKSGVIGMTAAPRVHRPADMVKTTLQAVKKESARAVRVAARGVLRAGAKPLHRHALSPDQCSARFVLRILRTRAAATMTRRVTGLAAFTSAGAAMSASEGRAADAPSPTERAVLTLAYVALQAGAFETATRLIEAQIRERNQAVSPLLLQRLADIYRVAGDSAKAESILRQALHQHPAHHGLYLSLADTLAQLGQWEQAIRCWEEVPEPFRGAVSVWTSIRISRAYRMSGNPQHAFDFLEGETRRHPWSEELAREAELCRPEIVDWRASLVRADAASPASADSVEAAISTPGFLAGGREALAGVVDGTDAESPLVQLCINAFPIASTHAAPASDASAGKAFSLNCADLLQYLGDGDLVQVLVEGKPMDFPGLGRTAMVLNGLPSQFDSLRRKVTEGYVFSKQGRLQPGHTTESKRGTLEFYAEVSKLIEETADLPVFPFYGSLLGAIRENDFIAHDVGGFDMVVVCNGSEARDVKDGFTAVCRLLVDAGYCLKVDPWSVLIRRQRADAMFLDLSYAWFDADEAFKVSFGWRFTPARGRKRFLAHRVCRLADRIVRVPGNSEELLEQIYGPQWRVPDQGYPVQSHLRRDEACLLAQSEMQGLLSYCPAQVELRLPPIAGDQQNDPDHSAGCLDSSESRAGSER